MLKKQLIELTKSGLDIPPGIKDRTMALYIELAFGQFSKEVFGNNWNKLDLYSLSYDNCPVLYNEDTDVYYTEFPAPIMQQIAWMDGLRRITKMKGRDVDFEALYGGMDNLLESLELGNLYQKIGYMVRNGRIEYYNMDDKIKLVRVEMVPGFTDYDDDKDFPLPNGLAMNIVTYAQEMFRNNPEFINTLRNLRAKYYKPETKEESE